MTEVIKADLFTSTVRYTLENRIAVEWFSFDPNVNVADAIGASVGTVSLDEMNFTNVTSVGVYSAHTFSSPSDWHGLSIISFAARFPSAPPYLQSWAPRMSIPTAAGTYGYDLTEFASQFARLHSAPYVMVNLTAPANSTQYSSPNPDLAAIVDPLNECFPKTVVQGGRDLLDEVITAIEATGKKAFVYFGSSGLDSDKAPLEVQTAWNAHIATLGLDNREATRELILRYYAEKFGSRICGYWFDGSTDFSADEQQAWKDAMHAGNPEALAAFGAGVANASPAADYTTGHPYAIALYGPHWDPKNELMVRKYENGPWVGNDPHTNQPTDVPADGALGHILFALQGGASPLDTFNFLPYKPSTIMREWLAPAA